MRPLTEGEAAVIRALLASELVSERERILRSGLPSRTFEGARRRAYAEGWVFDRYVPDPSRVKRPFVTLVLAQPYAERFEEVVETWTSDIGTVLLWCWEETLFRVVFSRNRQPSLSEGRFGPQAFRKILELTADTRMPQIPIYFDFEGAWCRLANLPGTRSYPHPLVSRVGTGRTTSFLSNSERTALAGLLKRPFETTGIDGPLRVSSFFLPRSQHRLLREMTVEHRVFLDLARIPPYRGRLVEKVAFVQGTLCPGVTATTLFQRLATIHILPFLFATDEHRVLLGTLSPAPDQPNTDSPRPAVLRNLERCLQAIEIVREDVTSTEVRVNHRYDRLLPQNAD